MKPSSQANYGNWPGGKVLPHCLCLLAILLSAAPLSAVQTRVWQVGDFKAFLAGHLNGVSISKSGRLELAPQAKVVFNPEEALALSLAADAHHNLYIGTGHQGKVFRVSANGKSSLFFTAPEPDIFALAVGPDGDLYVGSSPEGKIYRITPSGKSSVYFNPDSKYIWALAFDRSGNLYAGTGDQGQIFRVNKDGKGSVFYDSAQTHVMCLAFDHSGNLLAGSEPDGLVYRINPSGKAFILYQADLPEIHSLAVDSKGDVYAAALGGSGGKGLPMMLASQNPVIEIPTGAITVTADTAADTDSTQVGPKPKKPNPKPKAQKGSPSFIHPGQKLEAARLVEPQSRGALVEIAPDSSVQTLWTSNKESAYGLALLGERILFSTDSNGQIFELEPSNAGENLTLLTETHESIATRLLELSGDLYIATSNVGKLFRMDTRPATEGTYISAVKDANFVSHWGVLAWRGDFPSGTSVEFYTRSGNFMRPDHTWSDWAGPYRDPNGSQITSPPARYIQWKAVLRGSGSSAPSLDEVSMAFLNQNLRPEIHSFRVSDAAEQASPASAVSSTAAGITMTVSADPGGSGNDEEKSRQAVTMSWQADDPNGDTLVYSLELKAADEKSWHLLKDNITGNSYKLDSSTIADGEYQARLTASDSPSNSSSVARKVVRLSPQFWVDNTPPEVTTTGQKVSAGEAVIHFRAEDTTSPLQSAQISTDGKTWQDINSDDGIVDSQTETFTIQAHHLLPGEHVISLRAYDTAGNVGIAKAVLEIPASGGEAR